MAKIGDSTLKRSFRHAQRHIQWRFCAQSQDLHCAASRTAEVLHIARIYHLPRAEVPCNPQQEMLGDILVRLDPLKKKKLSLLFSLEVDQLMMHML